MKASLSMTKSGAKVFQIVKIQFSKIDAVSQFPTGFLKCARDAFLGCCGWTAGRFLGANP
jgi:hypothetical protein